MGTVNIMLSPENACYMTGLFPQLNRFGFFVPHWGLAYDSGLNEVAFWKFKAYNFGPTNSNIGLKIDWRADNSVATGQGAQCMWFAGVTCISGGDTVNMGTMTPAGFSVASGLPNPTRSGNVLTELTIADTNNCKSGELVFLTVGRSGTHAGDAMIGDAVINALTIFYLDN